MLVQIHIKQSVADSDPIQLVDTEIGAKLFHKGFVCEQLKCVN